MGILYMVTNEFHIMGGRILLLHACPHFCLAAAAIEAETTERGRPHHEQHDEDDQKDVDLPHPLQDGVGQLHDAAPFVGGVRAVYLSCSSLQKKTDRFNTLSS